jgi:hypothetical protein
MCADLGRLLLPVSSPLLQATLNTHQANAGNKCWAQKEKPVHSLILASRGKSNREGQQNLLTLLACMCVHSEIGPITWM